MCQSVSFGCAVIEVRGEREIAGEFHVGSFDHRAWLCSSAITYRHARVLAHFLQNTHRRSATRAQACYKRVDPGRGQRQARTGDARARAVGKPSCCGAAICGRRRPFHTYWRTYAPRTRVRRGKRVWMACLHLLTYGTSSLSCDVPVDVQQVSQSLLSVSGFRFL